MRFLYSQHPEIAKRWAAEGGGKGQAKKLPARKRPPAKRKRR